MLRLTSVDDLNRYGVTFTNDLPLVLSAACKAGVLSPEEQNNI
jgi:hypothetical protein